MKVKNIRLRIVNTFIVLAKPAECPHEWEQHLWERDTAYCALCGSYAEKDKAKP